MIPKASSGSGKDHARARICNVRARQLRPLAEQTSLPLAATTRLRPQPDGRRRRGIGRAFPICYRADMPVMKLDVERETRADLRCGAQWLPRPIAHQREATCEHAVI